MIEIKIHRNQIEFFRYNFITLQAEGTYEKTIHEQKHVIADGCVLNPELLHSICHEIKYKVAEDLGFYVSIKFRADGKIYLEHDALAFPYEAIGEWRLFNGE